MSAEVYGLCVGKANCYESELFPDASSCVEQVAGAPTEIQLSRGRPVTYLLCAYVVQTPSRVILVDTGCNDPEPLARYDVYEHRTVKSLLAELNIAPSDVSDVVITHGHWANIGGLADFLHSRVWIANDEIASMQELVSADIPEERAYRWSDLQTLQSVERLERVNRCRAISADVRLDMVSGHTAGFMTPTFLVDGLPFLVLAGDNLWFFANLEGRKLSPALRFGGHDPFPRMKVLARHAAFIPGRDSRVFERSTVVAPGIVRLYPQ